MSLEHILLGMLREPASGYELKTAFEQSARHFWSAELAQIYPTLKRMEQRGWLQSHVEPSAKGPQRRVYRRTEAGREELLAWLRSGPQLGTERFAYIGQLCFLHELEDLHSTLEFLHTLRGRLAGWLEVLRGIDAAELAAWGSPQEASLEDFHGYLGLRMGVHSLAAKVEWCDEVIEMVRSRIQKETMHA